MKISLHVCTAKRKGEGVTVLRGYFAGAPSRNNVSRPAEAGEGGDPDDEPAEVDNNVAKDFLGDATLLNFRICNGALCCNPVLSCSIICCSISISIILTKMQLQGRSESKGINGETSQGDGDAYLSVPVSSVSLSASGYNLCDPSRTLNQEPASVLSRP